MNTLEIKGGIVELMSDMNFKQLQRLYKVVREFVETDIDSTDLAEEYLTPEQQLELEEAITESYDEKNLTSHEEALKILSKWRKQ